eukprot:62923_1
MFGNEKSKSEETFLDGLYVFIAEKGNIKHKQLQDIRCMFKEEQYDSDAIEMDISTISCSQSNIFQNNNDCYHSITQYIHQNKLHQHTFSVGYRFYYWEHYSDQHQKRDDQQLRFNVNHHGGHEKYELYIKAKYTNIKNEILNNKIFSL